MSSIFNKFRPKHFSDVLGQDSATKTISSQLTEGNLPQVNLFFGVHGCGKTSMARILAKTVNCDNPTQDGPCGKCDSCLSADNGSNPDIIEIDAAANNGVSDIDIMVKNVQYLPFYKKKVVILDEVHNLSKAAFDHLLKPVEEPPAHAVFIFCTTEEKKLPSTILSRCPNKISFNRINDEMIRGQLISVCESEEISYDEDAITLLIQEAEGSLRDALSALEQVSYNRTVTKEKVLSAFSSSTDEQVITLLKKTATLSLPEVCGDIAELVGSTNIAVFLQNTVSVLLDIMMVSIGQDIMHLNGNGHRGNANDSYRKSIRELCSLYTEADAKRFLLCLMTYLKNGTRELGIYSIMVVVMMYMLKDETTVTEIKPVQKQPSICGETMAPSPSEASSQDSSPSFDGTFIGKDISQMPSPVSALNGFKPVDPGTDIPFPDAPAVKIPGVVMENESKKEEETVATKESSPEDTDSDEGDFTFGAACLRLF